MAAAVSLSSHIQLTWIPYSALWSSVAAANSDAAALLELQSTGASVGHVVSNWMGCRQMQQNYRGHVCADRQPAA